MAMFAGRERSGVYYGGASLRRKGARRDSRVLPRATSLMRSVRVIDLDFALRDYDMCVHDLVPWQTSAREGNAPALGEKAV